MHQITYLPGRNLVADASLIKSADPADVWFVLDNRALKLNEYLTNLYDEQGLKNSLLCQLRICANITWIEDALQVKTGSGKNSSPANMAELLRLLLATDKAIITIRSFRQLLYAQVAQQLVYLRYPLDRITIKYSDNPSAAIEREFRHISDYALHAQIKVDKKRGTPTHKRVYESLSICRTLPYGTHHIPLRIAMAASKKSGKSTLLNCILGNPIAPSHSEVATPSACEYISVNDPGFRLHIEQDIERYSDASALNRRLSALFREASYDQGTGYAMHDIKVEYPGKNLKDWILVDTPGPDASGTAHRIIAEKALQESDAVIFIIDYTKYLTDSEAEYLASVRAEFAHKRGPCIVVLNKMDQSLTDSNLQSAVKSCDFIRARLKAIDPRFGKFLVLPVSALAYTDLLTLALSGNPCLSKLLQTYSVWTPKACKDAEEQDNLDEGVKTALINTIDLVKSMRTRLRIKEPTTNEIMRWTGIPQLLAYLTLWINTHHLQVMNAARAFVFQTTALKNILAKSPESEKELLQNICENFLVQATRIEELLK